MTELQSRHTGHFKYLWSHKFHTQRLDQKIVWSAFQKLPPEQQRALREKYKYCEIPHLGFRLWLELLFKTERYHEIRGVTEFTKGGAR